MTQEQLNEYSIFTLREIARRAGVESPTSKKKAELIKEIMEITEGKREPRSTKSKQGRPPKNFGYSFIDVFNPEKSVLNNQSTKIVFNQEKTDFVVEENRVVTGYIEQVNANTAFLWVKNNLEYSCYLVSNFLVNKYVLKSGDLVCSKLGTGDEKMMVKEILSINACPINKYTNKRKDYSEFNHTESNKYVKFNFSQFGNVVKYGENLFLYGTNTGKMSGALKDMVSSCGEDRKIYINLSITEKNKSNLSQIENAECFVAQFTESIEKSKKLISIALERAKRLFEKGENVVIFIDDVLSLCSIDLPEQTAVKNLMSISKNALKGGSISIVAIMNNKPELNVFERLADNKLIIE